MINKRLLPAKPSNRELCKWLLVRATEAAKRKDMIAALDFLDARDLVAKHTTKVETVNFSLKDI